MPLVNSFLKESEFSDERRFELAVGFCPNCTLVQLMEVIDPKELFEDYIYFSSTSKLLLQHSEETANDFTKRFELDSESLVLEVASNDGILLQFFKKLGVQILGVDPAKNIAKVANERGIRTIPEFFNYAFAKKLKDEQDISADLIFGANVLAHVPDITDFVQGVQYVLKPKGTAVFEFPYLRGLLENKFDIIYHEHVFYYSLLALRHLFRSANLEIYDVEMTAMQGGSLRIFASHPGVYSTEQRVEDLLAQERKDGFDRLEIYQQMGKNVQELKDSLLTLLEKLKGEGKSIAAYGAAAKGIILLNYFDIDSRLIDFIADKSEAKQGFFTPGTHMEVFPPEKVNKDHPDYVLILCWNIADEIVEQFQEYHDAGGKFIIPVPSVKLL